MNIQLKEDNTDIIKTIQNYGNKCYKTGLLTGITWLETTYELIMDYDATKDMQRKWIRNLIDSLKKQYDL